MPNGWVMSTYIKQQTGGAYFTLAQREDGRWSPQFGSFDPFDVDAEFEAFAATGEIRATDLRVIKTDGTENAIAAKCAELNAE